MRRPRLRLVLGLGIPLLVVAVFLASWAIDTSSASGKVPRNVTLAGRDVGRFPEDDLAATVADVSEQEADAEVRVRTDDTTYTAKAGVNKLTENLALELAPSKIRVVGIAPGYTWLDHYGDWAIKSRERNVQRIPAGRYTNPEEIGAAVVFLCSDAAASITGTVLSIDGGALLPVLTDNGYA